MKYLWVEDSGAGCHFWELVNTYNFNGEYVVESKSGNEGILQAVNKLVPRKGDTYYIIFDHIFNNQDIVLKYCMLEEAALQYPGQIILLDYVCFEYLILSFSKLVEWTGTGKKDVVAVRDDILNSFNNYKLDPKRLQNDKSMLYINRFKRPTMEKILKSLTNELTENGDWSVKTEFMGDCWYKDCCNVKYPSNRECGHPDIMDGCLRIKTLIKSPEVQHVINSMNKKFIF